MKNVKMIIKAILLGAVLVSSVSALEMKPHKKVLTDGCTITTEGDVVEVSK